MIVYMYDYKYYRRYYLGLIYEKFILNLFSFNKSQNLVTHNYIKMFFWMYLKDKQT